MSGWFCKQCGGVSSKPHLHFDHGAVAPGRSVEIVADVPAPFAGTELRLIHGVHFRILALVVNGLPELLVEVPARALAAIPLRLSVAKAGETIRLEVQNDGPEPSGFRALLLGRTR